MIWRSGDSRPVSSQSSRSHCCDGLLHGIHEVAGVNKEEIQTWIADEGIDSDWVRVHVRGLFPRQSELQFIGRDVVERARHYKAVGYEELPKILACDVARSEAGAQTVFG